MSRLDNLTDDKLDKALALLDDAMGWTDLPSVGEAIIAAIDLLDPTEEQDKPPDGDQQSGHIEAPQAGAGRG